MKNTKIASIGTVFCATLLAFMLSNSVWGAAGICRDAHCGKPKVPKEKDWKKCRKQDTFKGCCAQRGGKYSATGRTGFAICCWEGTPETSGGSTTVIEARGGDVYQFDTQGRPCSELMVK